jgi:outer membrane receptor protein involved in Fe transport
MNGLLVLLLLHTGNRSAITVTAERTAEVDTRSAARVATTHLRAETAEQPLTTVADLLKAEPNILLQTTTPAQASPFLRGLTGYQVLNLVDGVRYNNATFRSGPNQYLALLEPSQIRAIEAVLGPSSAEYGSDALGGVIQVLTPASRWTERREVHGTLEASAQTADLSAGGSGQVQVSSRRWSWLAGGSGHQVGDLRAGGGADSRNALARYLGIDGGQIRGLLGNRQIDTKFQQAGAHTKAAFRPNARSVYSAWYQHSTQSHVENYKDLWGGLGRLRSSVTPQSTDLLYARAEWLDVGWLDSLSGTFSLNRQRDGAVRQNLRTTDSITVDNVTVNALGYSGLARTHIGRHQVIAFGGELYDESIEASRLVNGRSQRPLYPDGSGYRTNGVFAQDSLELFRRRLRLTGGVRYTRVKASVQPDTFSDFTYNASASWQLNGVFGLQFATGRGFRAPNANDLSVVGLNDLGYEVPVSEAVAARGLLATNAGEGALSSGRPLSGLVAESLRSYEAGFRVSAGRFYFRAQGFWADLKDPIVRRTLLFPANNPPTALGGQPVTVIRPTAQQAAQGVVTVATPVDPRAVKSFVNDGASRYYGLETLAEYRSVRWLAGANYSYILGRDLNPNRNIRRLPPAQGAFRVRRVTGWRGLWVEGRLTAAAAQDRLSGGDLDDERIGASRSRNDIAAFFNGARLAPYIRNGVFQTTGESLPAIQNRVLPGIADSTRVALFQQTSGWVAIDARAGVPLTEQLTLTGGVLNLADRNYRIHGSGADAAGRSFFGGVRFQF